MNGTEASALLRGLRGRRIALRAGLVAVMALVGGCLEATEAPVEPTPDPGTVATAFGASTLFTLCPQNGPPCGEIETNVSLKVVDCSAEIMCKPTMMRDKTANNAPAPTLLASLSCGFPQGTPAQDALLTVNPTLRCYKAGNPAVPSTWDPPGGIAPTFAAGERLAFSQQASTDGRVFTSWSYLMRPLREASTHTNGSFGFCTFEAWGTVVFTGLAEGEPADATCLSGYPTCPRRRDPHHIRQAPVVRWQGLMNWDGSAWNCNATGANPATTVNRIIVDATVHDTPSPDTKGLLPAEQTHAIVSTETRIPPGGGSPHASLMLRFAEDSRFPEIPMANPVPMQTRDLWVEANGVPLAVEVAKTCAQFDPVRVLARIGVLLADPATGSPLGAVVIHRDGTQTRAPFDCDRVPAGSCELLDEAEWAPLTPCLADP